MRKLRWLVPIAVLAGVSIASPARAATPAVGHLWHEDLLTSAASRVNIVVVGGGLRVGDQDSVVGGETRRTGYVVTPARRLATPVNRLRASMAATVPAGSNVAVEVRGRTDGGHWSEWSDIDASDGLVLSAPVSTVQVRVTLMAKAMTGPVVSDVSINASLDRRAPGSPGTASALSSRQPLTYRVFATREGLVGGRTANGHIIGNHDHFVALPSRRGLNSTPTGRDYQVRVCYGRTGLCETAPVWDVGPWNIKDDYWNASTTRQMWKDLPQGTPEAQAARLNGYNGGRDGFGRKVVNPAGIDLADGTFWDGLRMTDNDWVTVSYLWT